jgi:hypothetical protein
LPPTSSRRKNGITVRHQSQAFFDSIGQQETHASNKIGKIQGGTSAIERRLTWGLDFQLKRKEKMTRTLLKSLNAFSLIGAVVVYTAGSIWAAVPENLIQSWQASAPEAVNVTVLSKDETSSTRPYEGLPGVSVTVTSVTLTSQVDAVHRTPVAWCQVR